MMLSKVLVARTTVNNKQMELFNKISGWWHPAGPSQILFQYNYQRIKFLRKHLNSLNLAFPLQNKKILDVGCGAGFLTESLTRLGAQVVGLDPNLTSYNQAIDHKKNRQDLSNLTYQNKSLQEYLKDSKEGDQKIFDVVTSMEVIQHVNDPRLFIKTLASCTKQNGLVMLSTIRRSPISWLTHVIMAQNILKIVPRGTHHHQKFINPNECIAMLKQNSLQPLDILQLQINWKGELEEKKNGDNYLIIARKN